LHIILGKYFDGRVYWGLQDGQAVAGQSFVGPADFLHSLENQLGLPVSPTPAILRVSSFEAALKKLDSPERFYHQSFQKDSFGVAQLLLSKRDEMLLAAPVEFTFSRLDAASERIRLFSELEEIAELSAGVADRIRVVVNTLNEQSIPLGVKNISLIEPHHLWEPLWQCLFNALQKRDIPINVFTPEKAHSSGNLKKAVAALNSVKPSDNMMPKKDDTLLSVEAVNQFEAADAVALLVKNLGDSDNTVIIASQQSDALAQAFSRMDIPGISWQSESRGPDGLYIVPLLLQMAWRPVDPVLMRQYLLLSISPVPGRLRRKLLVAMQKNASVGGSLWDRAIERFCDTLDENKEKTVDRIRTWLDTGTLDREESLESSKIAKLCTAFLEWARPYAAIDENTAASLLPAIAMIESFLEICSQRTSDHWKQSELIRCFGDLTAACTSCNKTIQEKGAPAVVTSPGALCAPADTIIWWNAGQQSLESLSLPFWTNKEIASLDKQGIALQSADTQLEAQAHSWRTMAALAGKRLVLAWSRNQGDDGKPDEVHPFWHELTACFDPGHRSELVIHAEDIAAQSAGTLFDGSVKIVNPAIHPSYEQEWQLLRNIGSFREYESPSSVQKLCECPLSYVFHYGAYLRGASESAELASGPLLWGNIAHDIIEQYLNSCNNNWPSIDTAAESLGAYFDTYTNREASALYLPGREGERAKMRRQIVQAGTTLVKLLKEQEFVFEDSEKDMAAAVPWGELKGRCDLLLKKKEGKEFSAVIDIKWSRKSGRRDELKNGKAVQLAAYAKLVGGASVPTAYCIVNDGVLLSVHPDVFPSPESIEGPSEEEVWNNYESMVLSYKNDVATGKIALYPEPFKKDELQKPCCYCDYKLFCRVEQGGGNGEN